MFVMGDDNQENVINLNQVRMIQKLSDQEAVVIFDPNHTLHFHGDGAMKVLSYCAYFSVLMDGTPVADVLKNNGEEKSD